MAKSAVASPSKPDAAESDSGPFIHRMERLARTVADLHLGFLLVTNPKDVGYLTGFLGGDSYLLLPALSHKARRPILISDFRYKEELEEVQGVADVFIRTKSIVEAVGEVVGSAGAGAEGESGGLPKIGIQAEHLTIAEKAAIGRKLGPKGAKRLADTVNLVPKLRVIKDDTEIALIRKAARIQEAALTAVLPSIKVGMTESDVAAEIEAEMKRRGSSEPGFQTIVAAGANGSLPHYRPQQKKLAANKPLLIDWGAVYKGYHADMTRTFALGKWPPKIAEIYKVVLEAQELAAAALAPGKLTTEIDAIARKHIAKAGYAEFFGHGLGHGLGLNGHEDPRLTNMLAGVRLEAGMVVTIEPGIYLPGEGGVRIEDDYAITEHGALNLCSMKKSLEWCTL
jgi:Xaa-Pro aminopeptidase